MTATESDPPAATGHATFAQWDSQAYLRDYYARLQSDERHTLAFLVQQFARQACGPRALAFGVGPTLHHLIALSAYVREIHAADFLPDNLEQVRRWCRREPGAHDWSGFTRHILACEGLRRPGAAAVREREELTRGRITALLHADAADPRPVAGANAQGYDLVLSCYCAESATADRSVWRQYMKHIAGLLRPGGQFVTAALRRCRGYRIGDRLFPCADIDESDLTPLLSQLGFDMARARLRVVPLGEHLRRGYGGIVLVAATLGPEADCRAPSAGP